VIFHSYVIFPEGNLSIYDLGLLYIYTIHIPLSRPATDQAVGGAMATGRRRLAPWFPQRVERG